jgi:UDP-N-acetylmuramate: L-alanyl-gamma-D-glutamyl-meso-diaminopimelate ligase
VPRSGLLVLGADSDQAMSLRDAARCSVTTFGLSDGADWQGCDLAVTTTGTTFRLRRSGRLAGDFEIPLPGAHNVRNALAAMAVATAAGIPLDALRSGLRRFQGVKRRLEFRGSARGVLVYDDFAHHPTAIAETLGALRLGNPAGKIWAIFEPRSATSCLKVFHREFVQAFSPADETIIAAVYRSQIPEERRLSAEEVVADLRQAGHQARHVPTVAQIVDVVAQEARAGDVVVIMSNGGFDGIHDKLIAALNAA